jgi:hypothetical protein
LTGRLGYDEGVHLAGAQQLLQGALPYLDFTFLHPPGVLVLLLPFAALGELVGSDTALVAARLAIMVVGAANAALVAHLLREFGTAAALVGGGAYAGWAAVATAERAVLLEPLLNLGLLGCLALLAQDRSRSYALASGVVLGLTCGVKVWPALLAATVLLVLLLSDRGRAVPWTAGLLLGGLAWVLPTLALAGETAVEQVLRTQAGRQRRLGLSERLTTLDGSSGLDRWPWTVPLPLRAWLVVLVLAVLLLVGLRLGLWLWSAVAAVALVEVLVLAPSFYRHYGAYTAPGLALLVGAAGSRVLRGRALLPAAVVLATAGLALVAGASVLRPVPELPRPQMAALARDHACVWSRVLLLADVRAANAATCPWLLDGLGTRLSEGVRERDRIALRQLRSSDAALVLSERYAGWRTSRELDRYLRENFRPAAPAGGDVQVLVRRGPSERVRQGRHVPAVRLR